MCCVAGSGGVELRIYGADPDVAEAAARAGGWTVLAGSIDKPHGLLGSFVDHAQSLGSLHCEALALADIDGNGTVDIVVTDDPTNSGTDSVRWFSNDGSGDFSFGGAVAGTHGKRLNSADFNGDGSADILTYDYSDSVMRLYLNDGHGHFTESVTIGLGGYVFGIDTGILDL